MLLLEILLVMDLDDATQQEGLNAWPGYRLDDCDWLLW